RWGGQEVGSWEDLSAAIRAGGVAPTDVLVERDGERLTLTVTPAMAQRPVVEEGQVVLDGAGEPLLAEAPYVGIGPALESVRQPVSAVPGVVGDVLGGTVQIVLSLPARLVSIAQAVFTDAERDPSIVG